MGQFVDIPEIENGSFSFDMKLFKQFQGIEILDSFSEFTMDDFERVAESQDQECGERLSAMCIALFLLAEMCSDLVKGSIAYIIGPLHEIKYYMNFNNDYSEEFDKVATLAIINKNYAFSISRFEKTKYHIGYCPIPDGEDVQTFSYTLRNKEMEWNSISVTDSQSLRYKTPLHKCEYTLARATQSRISDCIQQSQRHDPFVVDAGALDRDTLNVLLSEPTRETSEMIVDKINALSYGSLMNYYRSPLSNTCEQVYCGGKDSTIKVDHTSYIDGGVCFPLSVIKCKPLHLVNDEQWVLYLAEIYVFGKDEPYDINKEEDMYDVFVFQVNESNQTYRHYVLRHSETDDGKFEIARSSDIKKMISEIHKIVLTKPLIEELYNKIQSYSII